jgi:hypothetical protein
MTALFVGVYFLPLLSLHYQFDNIFLEIGNEMNDIGIILIPMGWLYFYIVFLYLYPGKKIFQIYSKGVVTTIRPFLKLRKIEFIPFKQINEIEIIRSFENKGRAIKVHYDDMAWYLTGIDRLDESEFERSMKILINAYEKGNIRARIKFNEN